jgi:glycine cleavage system aminomethyltransferase T
MILDVSPFHARAVEANRLNAWETRGRFTLASHYGSVAEEAIAARFGAVVADVSWHWRVELSGDEAPALVSRFFTRNAAALGIGAAMTVLWLSDAGAVRGQGTVIRLERTCFLLESAANDAEWIANAARLYGVRVEDRTGTDGALALIGPAATKILKAAGIAADLPPLFCRCAVWDGVEVSLARLDLGNRIGCKAVDAPAIWDRLFEAGRAFALMPVGQAALDILEIENGLVRPCSDYLPAREGFAVMPTPQSLGLSALVDRAHLFNGRAGVLAAGPDTTLAGLLVEGEPPRPGSPVLKETETVGRTLGGCFSPAMRQAIAIAVLPDPAPKGPFTIGGSVCRPVGLPFLPNPAATEIADSVV